MSSSAIIGKMFDTLIHDPKARADRAENKRQMVLAWLCTHTWSTAEILAHVMSVRSRQGAHTTLVAMIRDGLVRRTMIRTGYGRDVSIFGLTPHGAAIAVPIGATPSKSLEPSKIKVSTLEHECDIQHMHLRAQAAGWTDWRVAMGEFARSDAKYPDALVVRPDGQKVAIEIERSIKSSKRYAEILVAHLAARREGKWEWIYYLCPTADIRDRVRYLYAQIQRATWRGQMVEISSAHRAPFIFFTYQEEWL